MDYVDLKNEISELIERQTEGMYWDFKQQWHSNNADLIHDIICMANSPANRDCYIIIGVEDQTYKILGVTTEKRKNQQKVIDLLRQKPKWAGGYIPEVYVKSVSISEKEIDIIIIKQSNNTPFYLLEDYKNEGSPIFKGAIYTRKGDTNTPKTSTADLYDTEILWKRRFGLLYNPSQRAKYYLADLENWERIDGEIDKSGNECFFFYYKLDPDYTIYLKSNTDVQEKKDINEVGVQYYYLFGFCNISYHIDFSNSEKIILYYKDIPLFSSPIEAIDERRTQIIPPKYWSNSYYIKDSFRYLIFEFVMAYICGNYSSEAKTMLLRVIPLYESDKEHEEFIKYIENKGFLFYKFCKEEICDKALIRFDNTTIRNYEMSGKPPYETENISEELESNKNLVINFAQPNNKEFDEINKYLKIGKMLVDWLDDWRHNKG